MSHVIDLGSGSDTESRMYEDEQVAEQHANCNVRQHLDEELGDVDEETVKIFGQGYSAYLTNPQIYIGNYGPLEKTLSEENTRYIIHSGHQAPFGKGNATIVDRSVRKTWELNAAEFELRGTGWPIYIQSICRNIARAIGVNEMKPGFHAELYKMLLYEQGALFKSHQDTEKVPGMFGTLVVGLLSPHTGGDVVTRHNGLKEVLQTSAAPHPYLWWYSDVHHEVLPVQTGTRWVLTYNLVRDNDTVSLPVPKPITVPLERILEAWRYQTSVQWSENKLLVYLLDHQYTEASMKLALFKGADLRKAAALKQACDQTGFLFYLAFLQEKKIGSAGYYPYDPRGDPDYWDPDNDEDEMDEEEENNDDHSIEEVVEDDYLLTAIFDTNGQKITIDLMIDEQDVIQENPFGDDLPDAEEFEDYTGNEGAFSTHWYRSAAIVIVPPTNLPSILGVSKLQPNSDSEKASLLLRHLVNSGKDSSALRSLLQRLIDINIEAQQAGHKHPTGFFGNELSANVIKGCLLINDWDLCARALKAFTKIDTATFKVIGQALHGSAFSLIKTNLEPHFAQFKRLTPLYEALENLLGGDLNKETVKRGKKSGAGELVMKKLEEALYSTKELYQEDASTLMQICHLYEAAPEEILQDLIVPTVKRHAHNTPFLIVFLNNCWTDSQGMDCCKARNAFEDVFRSLVHDVSKYFSLGTWGTLQDGSNVNRAYSTAEQRVHIPPITGQPIATFLDHCKSAMIRPSIIEIMLLHLQRHATKAHLHDLVPLFMDCLQHIARYMPKWSVPYTDPLYRQTFKEIFRIYIARCVGREPIRRTDWRRTGVQCNCYDCANLNDFMGQAYYYVARFQLSIKRALHLTDQINQASADAKTGTEYRGPLYTLVVTKTEESERSYLLRLNEWKKRKANATRLISVEFDDAVLRLLLGWDYDELTSMSFLSWPDISSRTQAAPAQLGRASPRVLLSTVGNSGEQVETSISTRKRKASELDNVEVIDLTEA